MTPPESSRVRVARSKIKFGPIFFFFFFSDGPNLFCCILTQKCTLMNQYSCKHVGIWANSSQAKIWALHEHNLWLSILSLDPTQVSEAQKSAWRWTSSQESRTPIRQSLMLCNELIDVMENNDLIQLVNFDTWSRVVNNTWRSSVLDHVHVMDHTSVKDLMHSTPPFGHLETVLC